MHNLEKLKNICTLEENEDRITLFHPGPYSPDLLLPSFLSIISIPFKPVSLHATFFFINIPYPSLPRPPPPALSLSPSRKKLKIWQLIT